MTNIRFGRTPAPADVHPAVTQSWSVWGSSEAAQIEDVSALNSSGSSRRTSARSLDCRCWLLLVLGWDTMSSTCICICVFICIWYTMSSTVLIWVPFTARSPPAGPPKRTQLVGSKLALARHEWEVANLYLCVYLYLYFHLCLYFEIVANHLGESMDTVQELVVSTLNRSEIWKDGGSNGNAKYWNYLSRVSYFLRSSKLLPLATECQSPPCDPP